MNTFAFPTGRNKFHRKLLTKYSSGTSQGVQSEAGIGFIQQPVECCTAGMHLFRHHGFRELLNGHLLLDLPGDEALYGNRRCFFQQRFFFKKIVKTAAYVLVAHLRLRNCFNLSLAKSKSGLGVFCCFLIKPWSSTITLPSRQNSTRTILESSLIRTSHRSPSIWSTRGMPSGQPNCTVLMSSPIAFLSAALSDLSQSRTGSPPMSVLKNRTSRIGFFICL